jgi:bifunctional DNase/RNase
MIEVLVNGIFLTQTQASGIILKEKNGDRTLPIVIGEYEAQSIALGLENIKPPRPITHDLAINLLESLGVKMESVLITELKNNTYYAVIRLRKKLKFWDVDARPSDAIAMAVRTTIPIYVNEEVMSLGSYKPDFAEKEKDLSSFGTMADEIDRLKEELKQAVENEEYEKAAEIRDKIKKLESES